MSIRSMTRSSFSSNWKIPIKWARTKRCRWQRNRPSLLERTHSLKSYIYSSIKEYVRSQLQHDHREQFNQKFRPQEKPGGPTQTPLNVADYARVPLLNANQMVSDWREKLPPIANEYDQQSINLGKRKPGVYLIEAVNGDLRAYSIAVVTNLTMVQKTTGTARSSCMSSIARPAHPTPTSASK